MRSFLPYNFYVVSEDRFRNESLQYTFEHPKMFLFIPNTLQPFFRKHNIVFVTACHNIATVDTYYEGYAHACYYKSGGFPADSISIDDITLTLVCYRHPLALINHWQERNYAISNIHSGIFYISKDGFIPTLLITISYLPAREYAWVNKILPSAPVAKESPQPIYALSKTKTPFIIGHFTSTYKMGNYKN